MNKRALFLDRDGVINEDHGYVHKIEDFIFTPGIFELARKANQLEYSVIVVTNQAGIGRGFYTESQFIALSNWMKAEFESNLARIDAIYFCPYHPTHGIGEYRRDSEFRKPNPGMLLKAATDLEVNLNESIMIGDKCTDMKAASAAGIKHRLLYRSKETCENCLNIQSLNEAHRFFI